MTAQRISCLLLAGFVGCSNADEPQGDVTTGDGAAGASGAASATCEGGAHADEFVPGMAKQTESGIEISLVEAEPEPPARLDNSWLISVRDADGEPVEGALLTLNPKMPVHGHGSPREAIVKELGGGQYRAEPVALIMPGFWTIDISVALDDEPPESVQFGFCIP